MRGPSRSQAKNIGVIRFREDGEDTIRRSGLGNLRGQHLVDAAPVEAHHLETPILPLEGFAHRRDMAELRKHEARKRRIFRVVDGEPLDAKHALDLEHRHLRVKQPRAVPALLGAGLDIGPGFRKLACDAGEDIGGRHDALHAAVLVEHDGHMHPCGFEHIEQFQHVGAFMHIKRRLDRGFEIDFARGVQLIEQRLRMHDADRFIHVAAAHREAGVPALAMSS